MEGVEMTRAWKEAQQNLAGGVNSPVRSFKAVGGEPVFMTSGKGPFLTDNHGKKYIDYCMSWGALLLGHAHPATIRAIQQQATKGTSFGTVTEYETALAQEIKKSFPNMERIRFTSSGTEAAMSAIRLARGITKRDRIVKFEGCYHGHGDSLLVKAGSGLATFGSPDSDGVPKKLAALTTVLPYNNLDAVTAAFKKHKDIACVIVEPIAANMGLVPGNPAFLQLLRKETKKAGALLIFDEVITGFRVGRGGVQHLVGVKPDITLLGKIIGGGLPIGAFGAGAGLMSALSPSGKVYQAGTLSGNPLSMAAGLSVLSQCSTDFYKKLQKKTNYLMGGIELMIRQKKVKARVSRRSSMFTIFFDGQNEFRRFFHKMLSQGIYLPPSAFETCFLSSAHTDNEIEKTVRAM